MSVSKTTMLFNLKFPSNDVKLKLNFFLFQIISLWMKNIGNLKSRYLKWLWLFSLEFFEKVLLGLASLYHIQMKFKTVNVTEQCQLMSHRNSLHAVRRVTKMSKTSSPWYRNLTVYSVMHFKLKHVLTAFFYPSIDWMQYKCINVSFFVQNALLKGSYWYANVDLDPLFISVNVLALWLNFLEIVANYA